MDGHRLALGLAVVVGPTPVAGPEHVASQLPMASVHGGALGRLKGPAGEHAHRHRRPRRPGGGQSDVADRGAGLLGHLPDRGELAHAALAGPHGHGRVALQQLQRVEPLVDRVADVVGGHVLAEAGEALAVACPRRPTATMRDHWSAGADVTSERLRSASRRAGPARRRARARARPRPRPREPETFARLRDRGRRPRRRRGCRPASVAAGRRRRRRPSGPWRRPAAAARWRGRFRPETATRSQSMPRSLSRSRATVLVELGDDRASDPPPPERPDHRSTGEQRDPRARRARRRARCRPPRAGVGHGGDLDAGPAQRQRGLEPRSPVVATTAVSPGAHPVEGGEPLARPSTASRRAGRCPRTSAAARSSRSPPRAGRRGPGAACCPARPGRSRRRSRARPPAPAPRPPPRGRGRPSPARRRRPRPRAARPRARGRRRPGPRPPPAPRPAAPRTCRRRRRPHQHVGVAASVLGAPLAIRLPARQHAETGGVAQDLLVQRPQAARPDEGLVVEAGRREPLAEDVGRPHQVEAQRRRGVHVGSTRMPARTGSVQARTPGQPSTSTRQFGHWPAQQRSPRGRWYLKLRESTRRPLACSAEPIVSPSKAVTGLPSKLKLSGAVAVDPLARSRREVGCSSVLALRQADPAHLVRCRVALGEEPGATAGAVVPPLALHAGDVAAEVVVGVQLTLGGLRSGSRNDLAAEGEVGDLALAAVGTGREETT